MEEIKMEDGRTTYRAAIYIPKAECEKAKELCAYKEEDGLMDRLGYPPNRMVMAYGAKFADDTVGDIRLIAYDDSFGVEAGLYEEKPGQGMVELALSDVTDQYEGMYEFSCGSDEYVLDVRLWDAQPGDLIKWHSYDEDYADEVCVIDKVEVDDNGETHFQVHQVDDDANFHKVHSKDCDPMEEK